MRVTFDAVFRSASWLAYRLGIHHAHQRMFDRDRVTCIYYHDVARRSPLPETALFVEEDVFWQHMHLVRKHYTPLGMSELLGRDRLPPYPLVLSFDGYSHTFLRVAEGLAARGIKPLFYLQTEPIVTGRPHWRQQLYFVFRQLDRQELCVDLNGESCTISVTGQARENLQAARQLGQRLELRGSAREVVCRLADRCGVDLGEFDTTYRPLTPDEVTKLAAIDGVEVGSHSHRHIASGDVPAAQARDELQTSKNLLQRWTDRQVIHYAYPSGLVTATMLPLLDETGYATAVVAAGRTFKPHLRPCWPYLIPRVAMANGPFYLLAGRLLGIDGCLRRFGRIRRGRTGGKRGR